MGQDKASLFFGQETMLQRTVRAVCQVVDPAQIIVVAGPQQIVPDLPSSLRIERDQQAGRGPLEGFAAGLRSLQTNADVVFLTSCDSPRLVPGFIERMYERIELAEIAVPFDGTFEHPLSAVYRTSLLPRVEFQLEQNRLSLRVLFGTARTQRISTEELREVDPALTSLENINTPEEYRKVLRELGLVGDEPAV